ncbi:hypothetical protein PsYK624_065570 [Phanerochaete sordida]|uniref:Protein kinase domain-containing protein n=1 Tax=Phanerochaete sordida TaxID=48140 RepID=A0A9P3GAP6_9APHY|nr:hypothetical protein PsYK624_065570 [Phanerochaete sordida]
MLVLVYTEHEPLESFLSGAPQYLGHMVYQMLNCLHDLHYKANISHHDVNFNNIVVRRDGPDGEPRFILNDLDLATRVSEEVTPLTGPTSRYFIETLPYMSWEILRDLGIIYERKPFRPSLVLMSTIHRLRYDYESLLYVAIRCCFMCEKALVPEEDLQEQIDHWEVGHYNDLHLRKHFMLAFPRDPLDGVLNWFLFSPNFEPWRNWLRRWVEAVSRAAMLAKSLVKGAATSASDDGTEDLGQWQEVDNLWSRDAILKALRGHEPEIYRYVYDSDSK